MQDPAIPQSRSRSRFIAFIPCVAPLDLPLGIGCVCVRDGSLSCSFLDGTIQQEAQL